MNILFFTDVELSPYLGGVERVTINLVKELNNRNHNCFLGYFLPTDRDVSNDFQKKYLLETTTLKKQLYEILTQNQIDSCVINLCRKQFISIFNKTLFDITRQLGNIKVVYGYYNYPGFELFGLSPSLALFRLTHGQCNSNTLHGIMVSLANKLRITGVIRNRISDKLKIGLYSDEIVLLSERYIPRYMNLIGQNCACDFSSIGNPLSYIHNIDSEKIKEKEKIVIQVARFEDNFKRQTTALDIWKIIEDNGNFDDWRFVMIGGGGDEQYIKRKAKKLQLKNVDILPAQDPLPFLERASIYMLTSAYEGLPMIVLDAQQQGVTPIGFDSFEAIHDIINQENGIVVPDNQNDLYANKLMWLMSNVDERQKMAYAGLLSCQQYSPKVIADKWEHILCGI